MWMEGKGKLFSLAQKKEREGKNWGSIGMSKKERERMRGNGERSRKESKTFTGKQKSGTMKMALSVLKC